ncbi:hypothetical protein BDZ88DRAFT_435291 [Geranomyces variabilis]|nr:hypothetical protein BDZ88DRAFT_435291 [Geranomyces variabilis]KAJ3131182.1 hypothetical protein HDU90_008668 [Geranomyces variabilis]
MVDQTSPYTLHWQDLEIPLGSEHDSKRSTAFFDSHIDERDGRICVICGWSRAVDHAHIVPKSSPDKWNFLMQNKKIPRRNHGVNDPRNGLTLCPNHHRGFDANDWCAIPTPQGVVFANPYGHYDYALLAGSLLRMDRSHSNAVFENLLTAHARTVLASALVSWEEVTHRGWDVGGGDSSGDGSGGGFGGAGGNDGGERRDLGSTKNGSAERSGRSWTGWSAAALMGDSIAEPKYTLHWQTLTPAQEADDALYSQMVGEERTAADAIRALTLARGR